ncbi:fumarate reductase subunit C [Rubrivivax gelatinosus]|nr:fumarate reductase subunit C [Rubrivivax gelatinosus]
MSRYKPTLKTYQRPMAGWWTKNPFYVLYMIREGSAVLLAAYALVLLVGLARLAQGEAEYEAWRAALASPAAIAFHLVAAIVVAYHSVTWFGVMPKTAPKLPFPARLVTIGGIAAAVVVSIALVVVIAGATR